MTLKQKGFIANITDIDNPKTFSNGTRSVMKAYNYDNTNMAAVQANNLLSNPKVQSEVDRIMHELDLGPKVRLKAIKKIVEGDHTQTTVNTTKKGRKTLYKSTTVKSPRASDVIKAVDLLSKIDGTYDKNKAKADVVSTELKAIFRQQRAELTGNRGRGKSSPT